jgi:glycosyltransferase involved in cell wall biosynthesis
MALTILHLCSLRRRNGTVHLASHLCRLQAAHGHRVLVGAREGSKLFEWAADGAVEEVHGLELRSGFSPRSLAHDVGRLRRVIRERGVDVVHVWQSAETYIAAAAVLGTGAVLVRSRTITKPVRHHLARPLLNRICRATFATCDRIEAALLSAGEPRESVHPLVEGVDTERFRPDPSARELRRELGIPADARVVVNVGRLEAVKGQVHFLEALARLPASLGEVHGLIAGEGRAREELERRRDELNLRGRLHLLGVRRDVPRVLAAADLYALTSIGSEGSSRATLEALATGLPVVCSDVGMLPDIVRRSHGRLVPPGDSGALAAALAELLGDGAMLAAMGRNAREFAMEERSLERMHQGVESVYASVVGRPRARPPSATGRVAATP